MARTAKKKTTRKAPAKKKATRKKVTKRTLPETPKILTKAVDPVLPTRPQPIRRPAPTRIVAKKTYKNFEKFKGYFDIAIGVLINTFLGATAIAAFLGFMQFITKFSFDGISDERAVGFVFLSCLIGFLIRTELED